MRERWWIMGKEMFFFIILVKFYSKNENRKRRILSKLTWKSMGMTTEDNNTKSKELSPNARILLSLS